MKNLKSFNRSVRQELNRVSMMIKKMEFRIVRFRGFLKRKLREEIQELRRLKNSIIRRLSELPFETPVHLPAMQSIRDDIALLQHRCRQLKSQHSL